MRNFVGSKNVILVHHTQMVFFYVYTRVYILFTQRWNTYVYNMGVMGVVWNMLCLTFLLRFGA